MKASQEAFELIKKYEGLRLRAYKPVPTEKFFTIGYGHTDESIKQGQIISLQKAEAILQEDVALIEQKLADYCPNLKQHEFDALVSLIYNIGWYHFRYSTTGNFCKDIHKVYSSIAVARRIILWVKAGGKTLLGLQKRRVEEANHFMGGNYFTLENGEIIETL